MTLHARYTILRKIADGGTAEIFLATQHGAHGFEKPVVLKRIFPAFYADPQFRNMLVDEAHIAMSLNHSNIVQVLDLGEAEGQYVLALELVDGWTLDAVLRRARALKTSVQPALALYMTAEVCRALAYAHAKVGADDKPLGIVHRDISPHNVLLSEQGEVKLTDFGIATARTRRESSVGNMIKGKIAYMSPEQASGAALDARSDLFSVGTMLYVMICGRYPFDAPTDLEVLLQVKKGDFEPPEKILSGLNPEIYRVIKRAMAKSPDDRYQRAEEMLIDVEQVMRLAFRAVGQTELKRWLQDLSMRDGVLPLTRTAPPSSAWISERIEGETLELKGVGTTGPAPTLPPPSTGGINAGSGPLLAAGTRRPGAIGTGRPPPPPAAMTVGRKPSPKAGATGAVPTPISKAGSISGPLSSEAAAPTTSPVATSAKIDTAADEAITPAPPAVARPHAHHLPSGTPHTPFPSHADEPATGEPVTPDKTLKKSGSFDLPLPSLRKSSSWVAEAVLASAQRAGTTPAPPISTPLIPPPVPEAAPVVRAETSAATDSEPVAVPVSNRRRALFVGSSIGAAVLLIVTLSARRCDTDSTVAKRPVSRAPVATTTPAKGMEARARSDAGSAISTGAARSAGSAGSDAPLAGLALAGTGGATATNAVHAASGGATVERQPSGAPAVVAIAPAPGAAGAQAESPAAIAPPPPVAPVAIAAGDKPAGSEAGRGDSSGGEADADAEAAAPVEKVTVQISSTPPGAQVGTSRRQFGATPVSVKLKVGRTYALIFTREGYRPVTKQFRVTHFPDQQVAAILRRDTPGEKAQPTPAVSQPPPPKQERGWLQRVFGR